MYTIFHRFRVVPLIVDPNINPVMRLNQYQSRLEYRLISQTGPVHEPVFTMSVDVKGKTYEASGPSKRAAKLNVAIKVKLINLLYLSEVSLSAHTPPSMFEACYCCQSGLRLGLPEGKQTNMQVEFIELILICQAIN